MSIQIQVRDYRGCARADIELAPIALVAGNNEQGKSSLAQAVRAGLTGVPIPIDGVAKKDAKLLVRDGAEEGSVRVASGESTRSIGWPKCNLHELDADGLWCSPFAVGLRYLFELDDKERANVLAGYINSVPDAADLHAAMADAEYSEKAIDQVWKSVTTGTTGWDDTHKKAKEHGQTLKGKWEAATGEAYGAKKAEGWQAPHHPSMVNTLDPVGNLEAQLREAKAELERVIGLAAVAKSDIESLREKAGSITALEAQELAKRKEKDRLSAIYDEWARKPYPKLPKEPMCCPKCNAALAVAGDLASGESLVEVKNPPTVKDITSAKQAIEQHRQSVAKAKAEFEAAYDAHKAIADELRAANAAKTELDGLKTSGGEIATESQVTEARAKVDAAQRSLNAYNATTQAAFLHSQIVKNAALVEILAPDGLRKRKLASGLKAFNETLEILCKQANWPAVRLDENLRPHYGTRPVWAASASGQWRASVVVQIAMAKMDGSHAVVIDEADILDQRGRNNLFTLLKATGLHALVCMTINKPDLMPDLEKAKLGQSYWLEGGVIYGKGGKPAEAAAA